MKVLKAILKVVPHALLVVTGMFITFLIIDTQNSKIGMIDSDLSKAVMAVWCMLSVICAITLIYIQRREARRQAENESKPSAADNHSAKPAAGDLERLERDLELILAAIRLKNGRGG